MTRAELALLSQAHAVAMTAMVAPESRVSPVAAAFALHEAVAADLPSFAPAAQRFVEDIRASHGRLDQVKRAGLLLRDAVSRAMAFVPHDAARVDIHG